jgi:hypothetical protein
MSPQSAGRQAASRTYAVASLVAVMVAVIIATSINLVAGLAK